MAIDEKDTDLVPPPFANLKLIQAVWEFILM